MTKFKDVTVPIVGQSNLANVIHIFRQKCEAYSMISESQLELSSIQGAKKSDGGTYQFKIEGLVTVIPRIAPQITVRYAADGEYRRADRRVYMTKLAILNDVTGLLNKVISATGIAVGRSLHVSEQDDALILSLLG